MDEYHDYYVTAAMNNEGHQRQRLIRAETKLQQRLIWRRGWRLESERNVKLWPSWPIQPIQVHSSAFGPIWPHLASFCI